MLFLGTKKARRVHELFLKFHTVYLSREYPNGFAYEYSIKSLFDSFAFSQDPEMCDPSNAGDMEDAKEAFLVFADCFDEELNDLISKLIQCTPKEELTNQVISALTNTPPTHNTDTIQYFRSDLANRARLVNEKTTFFYTFRICYQNPASTEHAFILEQYSQQGIPRYRLYQSWLDLATLHDDFTKRKLGPHGEGSWSEVELEGFLEALTKAYCQEHNHTFIEQCFGYTDHHVKKMPANISFDGKVLSGMILRYHVSRIDPESCLDNLRELIEASNDFYRALMSKG